MSTPRPIYREPLPIRVGVVVAGLGAGGLWMILFALLGTTARSYAWASLIAGVVAWAVAMLLARLGERGAAVGVAVAAGFGCTVSLAVVVSRWMSGDWILW